MTRHSTVPSPWSTDSDWRGETALVLVVLHTIPMNNDLEKFPGIGGGRHPSAEPECGRHRFARSVEQGLPSLARDPSQTTMEVLL